MRLSFVVTSFDIADYILPCLESLRPCVLPGDEVIVIDDGSRDGTDDRIGDFVRAGGYGPDVELRPILLGTNTPGGVGFGANLGLEAATRDGVFFVDGDDLMLAPGFLAARARFAAERPDILIADYLEEEDGSAGDGGAATGHGGRRRPADARTWDRIAAAGLETGVAPLTGAARHLALQLIAVPWRKFYARRLLERHRLRFETGDFFYEDNPFHWAVCLAAGTVGFSSRRICLHRTKRPGQTMAAAGPELAAFFTHARTISALLDARGIGPEAPERALLAEWLIGQMAWHLERLREDAMWDYALAAAPVLEAMAPGIREGLARGRFAGSRALRAAEQLRRAGPAQAVLLWQAEQAAAARALAEERLETLEARIAGLAEQSAAAARDVEALRLIAEFEALAALPGAGKGP